MSPPPPPPPAVSVIVATYRAGDYLRQALADVLAQTRGDFEVLVADDGRDPETRAIVDAFADARLVYECNPVTLGPAGNHWAAMRRARGEYLAILNHDDRWRPDLLRRLLAGFDLDSRVVVAFCDHDVIDSAGCLLPVETEALSQRTGRAVLAAGVHCPFPALAAACAVPAAQAAVFKKSALDLTALPGEAGPAYDLWLNFLLARTGGGAYYLPERLASWRTHPASISMTAARTDWPAGAGAGLTSMAAHPLFTPFRRALTRQAAGCFGSAAVAALRGGKRREAWRHAWRAVRLCPFDRRTLGSLALTLLPSFAWKTLLRT